ncbi:MAG: HpcH/HpaI aldolase/citrate lyase family protein [Saprospiraceae bacterium]|nr:HpcH/HpaI aldolase/citrate lyase family protein [Lewinella sp.]
MSAPKNKFLQKIKELETAYGIWNDLTDPDVGEILAGAGYDWIVIDAEHAPFDLQLIIGQLRAMAPYDVAPMVRPPGDDPVFIKQLLDAGVQTLLVPMVDTPEQAAELVQLVRYPPAGKRGHGAGLGRAARWGHTTDYVATADQQMCLIIQVETRIAYENLSALLEVDGVNGVFLGPADLSASMGYNGRMDEPTIIEMVKKAMIQVRKAGKIAGTVSFSPSGVQAYQMAGANMIGIGADALLLSRAVKDLIRTFREMR